MQKTPVKSKTLVIGIVLILLAVLARRFYFKSFNADSLIAFLAGFAIILVAFVIFRVIFRNKVNK